jgi:simple sugar transport system permease protein
MARLPRSTEGWLLLVIAAMCLILGLATDTFWTLANAFDLLNGSATNVIFAVGLLVVLVAGGIDISFAVAASVVQYVTATAVLQIGGGNWPLGLAIAALVGFGLGAVNAGLIHYFRIISIVVTIATFNVFFGFLMFVTHGVSIYNLPDWWLDRIIFWEHETASGDFPLAVLYLLLLAFQNESFVNQLLIVVKGTDGQLKSQIIVQSLQKFLLFCGIISHVSGSIPG